MEARDADRLTSLFDLDCLCDELIAQGALPDLIVKDRRDSQFGHKVCLTLGKSSLVLDCQVLEGNPGDVTLTVPMMERQQEVYCKAPQRAAFDGAFTSRENLRVLKKMGVKQVAFSKRRGIPIEEMCSSKAVYRRLRRFRPGHSLCLSS